MEEEVEVEEQQPRVLSRIILGEIERVTGRTLWNLDQNNVPPTRVTRRRVIQAPQIEARDTPPRVQNILPDPPHARVENEAENGVALPDGHTDTRTLILNLFIFLVVINFTLNIYILHYLIHIRFF